MKTSKLDTPHIKEEVVKRLAVGESQRSVAGEVGLDASSVCRFANRDEIRALIEQEQARLVEVVPDAVENVKRLVREMKDIPPDDTKRLELSYKASVDVLKATGLMPSNSQSPLVMNIFQQKEDIVLSPVVEALLDTYLAGLTKEPEG